MKFSCSPNKISVCLLLLMLASCGGGGGDAASNSSGSIPPIQANEYFSNNLASNAISLSVQNIYGNDVNLPYVSIKICEPGTTQCQTISNILLDTGSTGLRVLSSTLGTLQLTTQTYGDAPVVECATFISGVTWGPVKVADIKMSSELASTIPIQVIADPNYLTTPTGCSNGLPSLQSTSTLKANGILGIGLLISDGQSYYACPSNQTSNCVAITLAASAQVQNPVAAFAINNNGVVMQLPGISTSGAGTTTGSLYFGIDTQSNNSSNGASIIPTNSSGLFVTAFNGVNYRQSFIDSGSNGLFFPAGNQAATLKTCTYSIGFYCPATTQSYVATVPLQNFMTGTINFSIANADTLVSTGNTAFSNLGGLLENRCTLALLVGPAIMQLAPTTHT